MIERPTLSETKRDSDSTHSLPVLSRRTAVKGACATLGAAAFVGAVSPLRKVAEDITAAEFFQQHYQELTDEDKRQVFARLEAEAKEEYGAEVTIADDRPLPGTKFVYAINLSLCNGNRKCVEACNKENNLDRATNESYIRVLEMPKGTMDMAQGNTTYTHPVPDEGKFYLPVQCQQCDKPPCVDACPVQATWKEEDGIVVVDYNWCIGCRYCEAACPYHARRFNWKQAEIPADEVNPDQSYLSNRIRPAGVVEKCTYCLHRTRRGRLPACLEACPTGARVFGNILDPDSEIGWLLKNKRVFLLKEQLGTEPAFFYFLDE
jgi:molybdopterin-containing oxidoreductase family iron-sulfur binding subunit